MLPRGPVRRSEVLLHAGRVVGRSLRRTGVRVLARAEPRVRVARAGDRSRDGAHQRPRLVVVARRRARGRRGDGARDARRHRQPEGVGPRSRPGPHRGQPGLGSRQPLASPVAQEHDHRGRRAGLVRRIVLETRPSTRNHVAMSVRHCASGGECACFGRARLCPRKRARRSRTIVHQSVAKPRDLPAPRLAPREPRESREYARAPKPGRPHRAPAAPHTVANAASGRSSGERSSSPIDAAFCSTPGSTVRAK